MAGQTKWGMAGDSTNAYLVVPKRQKEIYLKSTYKSIVQAINQNRKLDVQIQRFASGTGKVHLGNTSAIWETEITSGNEERLTMLEHRTGEPGSYGDAGVQPGDRDQYKHAVVYINQIDSKVIPLMGRCSLKQVADILNDPKGDALAGLQLWAGQQIDWNFLRALLMGASPELLLTTNGALGIALPGASAGEFRSCYNTYVGGHGLITPSFTRTTHETNVGTGLTDCTDTSAHGFSYSAHCKMIDTLTSLFIKPPTMGGKQFTSIVLSDPWLVARLAATSGTYDTKMTYAEARGSGNPAIDHMSPIVLDNVLYIPVEQLKKFRPSVSGGLPVYGPGLSTDPRTYTNEQKICTQIWLGAGSILHASDRKMWVTAEKADGHKDNWEYCLHWDDGWVRKEYVSKDGRSEIETPDMVVAHFYDPGIETAFAA